LIGNTKPGKIHKAQISINQISNDEIEKKINKKKDSKEKKISIKRIKTKLKKNKGWIIFYWKAKFKNKNQFHKRIKEETTKRIRTKFYIINKLNIVIKE
jgi:hypoxanthine phosphoribosyltransferase